MRIVVVGAGAAGTLTVTALAQRLAAAPSAPPLEVVVVDPAARPVEGAAFGTDDPRHLLNVPAAGMSYDPEQRFDFAHWCVEQGLVADETEASYWFAPRREWARYLRDRLERAVAAAGDRLAVRHLRARVTGVARAGDGVAVETCTEPGAAPGTLLADQVVVATGLPSVGEDWAPGDLSGLERYVADPWARGAFAPVVDGPEGDVVVVGTGLTMVDVALSVLDSHPGRRVLALSRSGALPKAHAPQYLGEVVPDVRAWGSTAAEFHAAAHAHCSVVEQLQGDWRPGVDGIRYKVAELWGRLDAAERRAFVDRVSREWGLHRHRMPPSSAVRVAEAVESGRLVLHAGSAAAVSPTASGVRVDTTAGERLEGAWLVNCTGPRTDLRTVGNPVVDSLLGLDGSAPLAVADELGLGVVTREGQVVDPSGVPSPVWTLGALRRGELWESTAVPEIRQQAADLARALLAYGEAVGRRTA